MSTYSQNVGLYGFEVEPESAKELDWETREEYLYENRDDDEPVLFVDPVGSRYAFIGYVWFVTREVEGSYGSNIEPQRPGISGDVDASRASHDLAVLTDELGLERKPPADWWVFTHYH